ncbi:hypothetical protein [Actinoplanes sp. NPDC020271]|uniref:hypothetical protein n=1 Tax=Actinoplanes sp. NPDC020271 TaxID=3363896 RepID=UPI0037A70EB0
MTQLRRWLERPGSDHLDHLAELDDLVHAFERQQPQITHVDLLVALLRRPEPTPVLVQALTRCWAGLQADVVAFQQGEKRFAERRLATRLSTEADGFLHQWLALELARDVVRPRDPAELNALLFLADTDARMFRHLLAPAISDAHTTPPWSFDRILSGARTVLARDYGLARVPDVNALNAMAGRAAVSLSHASFLKVLEETPHGGDLRVLAEVARFDRGLALHLGGAASMTSDRSLLVASLQHPLLSDDAVDALRLLSMDLHQQYVADTGKAVGLLLKQRDLPRTADSVAGILQRELAEVADHPVVAVATLWAELAQLAEYGRNRSGRAYDDEVRGVLDQLAEHASRFPAAWEVSMQDLLHEVTYLGKNAADLIAYAATRSDRVRAAVETIAGAPATPVTVGHRARGIVARIGGSMPPDHHFQNWLAATSAQAFDGIPVTPRPLSSLSRTWLASLDLEDALSATLREALRRFGDWVRSQGAALEETGTGVLLSRIEAAFEAARLRVEAGGRDATGRQVSVSHRPVTKKEEQTWGCDIALVLDVELPTTITMYAAALVQVKKSEAIKERAATHPRTHERWKIDLAQLTDLQNMSEASFYWLLTSDGDVLCVRAQWVNGMAAGSGALETTQRTFTLGYDKVRHACVGLDQFLPELFLGAWVGDTRQVTLDFARGRTGLVPRHLFEVAIHISAEQG